MCYSFCSATDVPILRLRLRTDPLTQTGVTRHTGIEAPMLFYVEEIEKKLNCQPFLSLNEVKKKISSHASGFYWIYSNLPLERFKTATAPKNPVHVDFAKLSNTHEALNHVIPSCNPGWWCIYNGKGKQLKNRIVAEFTNTQGKTGKLALLRCFQESDFKIKYVVCGDSASATEVATQYSQLERHLERAWRLHVGWPVLCRA